MSNPNADVSSEECKIFNINKTRPIRVPDIKPSTKYINGEYQNDAIISNTI